MHPVLSSKDARAQVDNIRDALGKPADPKIKSAVAGLMRWGVHTTSSCEGHLDWGYNYPWIHCRNDSVNKVLALMVKALLGDQLVVRPIFSEEFEIICLEEELSDAQSIFEAWGQKLLNIKDNGFL